MRLIDADALKRRAITVRFFGKDIMMVSTAEIDDAPTIDAVSLVRCKDCRWYDRYGDVCHNPRYGDGYANYQPPCVDEDYWCKDGERKGGDDE